MVKYNHQTIQQPLKLGLHGNANANDICGQEARQNIWYIRTLFGICRGSELTLH